MSRNRPVVPRPLDRLMRGVVASFTLPLAIACGSGEGGATTDEAEASPSAESAPAAAAEAPAAPEAPLADACSTVTEADVNTLLTEVGRSTKVQMAYSPGAGYCQYPLADLGTLMLEPTRLDDAAAAQSSLRYSRETTARGTTVTDVPGIGDEAYEFKSANTERWEVHARRGRLVIVAWSGKGAKGPELARGLATLAFAKYPPMP